MNHRHGDACANKAGSLAKKNAGSRKLKQAGELLELLDHIAAESYPAELDGLDIQALIERYEAAKSRLFGLGAPGPKQAVAVISDFICVRTALRRFFEEIWPDKPDCSRTEQLAAAAPHPARSRRSSIGRTSDKQHDSKRPGSGG